MTHPLLDRDPDVGARWLCLTAGRRTQQEQAALSEAMATLPHGGQPLPASLLPPIPLEAIR